MLTATFIFLCTNFNKSHTSKEMREKEYQLKEVFGRFDNDLFDKAIREICRVEDFFPKQSVIFRYLERMKPASDSKEFEYCKKCKGKGRVGLILAIKWKRNSDGSRSKARNVVHREVWGFNRIREMAEDPNMKKHYDDPDTYISEQSCFCRCKRGRSMYQDNGGGLKLTEMEYARL